MFDLGEGSGHDASARIDDDLPPGARLFESNADGFAHPSFDPVPNHGATQGTGTGKSHPHTCLSIISQTERGEKRPGKLGALVVHSSEILGTENARGLWKSRYAVTSRR
jgi:hypothetical protein